MKVSRNDYVEFHMDRARALRAAALRDAFRSIGGWMSGNAKR
ncbi:MAG: hypothetical protein AAFN59_09790 [Pseudomonadota bacterium]